MSCTGVVKWFSINTGYGFIVSESHGDVFVHANSCPDGYILGGERVEFDVKPSPNNTSVQAVSVVRRPKPTTVVCDRFTIRSSTFVC